MVSKQSNLRPAGVQFARADLLVGAGSSFKELRKAKTSISDLQKIIDDHFNVPHVRIGETRNGSLYLTGLFDVVPDGVESQDHEAFDAINLLLGWIEGVFGLPEHSRSIVPKLFDESPIMEEGADLRILDDSKASVTNGSQILASYELPANQLPDEVNSLAYSLCKVPLNLDEKPDLAGSGSSFDSDVMLIEEKVRFDENRAKIRPIDESITGKDAANLDAYQVFDEMPTREYGHEFSSDVLTLHKSILETYVNSNFYLELHCFDPGGQVMLGDSWIANMKEQYNQDALKVYEMLNFECFDPGGLIAQRVFDETPRSLINLILHDPASFVVVPEIWVMCFDPGGSLCVFERDLTKQGRIVVRLIFDPGEVFKDGQICDADYYVTEFVFDPGGREMEPGNEGGCSLLLPLLEVDPLFEKKKKKLLRKETFAVNERIYFTMPLLSDQINVTLNLLLQRARLIHLNEMEIYFGEMNVNLQSEFYSYRNELEDLNFILSCIHGAPKYSMPEKTARQDLRATIILRIHGVGDIALEINKDDDQHFIKFALTSLSLRLMKRIALSYNGPRLEVFNSSLGMNIVLGSISKGCAVHLSSGMMNFCLGVNGLRKQKVDELSEIQAAEIWVADFLLLLLPHVDVSFKSLQELHNELICKSHVVVTGAITLMLNIGKEGKGKFYVAAIMPGKIVVDNGAMGGSAEFGAIDTVKECFIVLVFDPGGGYFELIYSILEAKDLSKRRVMIRY